MIHRFVCTRTALEKKETRPSISATNNRRKNLLVPNYRKLCLFLNDTYTISSRKNLPKPCFPQEKHPILTIYFLSFVRTIPKNKISCHLTSKF